MPGRFPVAGVTNNFGATERTPRAWQSSPEKQGPAEPAIKRPALKVVTASAIAFAWVISLSSLPVHAQLNSDIQQNSDTQQNSGTQRTIDAHLNIDIEQPPIEYSETEDNNAVSRLIQAIKSGETKLEYDDATGYLPALLEALDIPISSQVLVFSKTSMQVRYISRRNPRAIYFNDDTYVGWVRGSSLMEISTSDPRLGAAFYTVDMKPWRPDIERAYYDCLSCHTTSMTQGVPGHTVRSVLPHLDGSVNSQLQSYITDHSSPFSERWGGWYVTGRHGEMKHMGNAFLRSGQLDTRDNGNKLSLRDEFDTFDWLSPYSDIVALMVLEHQTQMHNAFTRASFTDRKLLFDLHKNGPSEESKKELDLLLAQVAREVVKYLLFCDETQLTSEVKGSILFANQFTKRGPTDTRGRSLREFDLQQRLFRYPCSYLIYSSAFDGLEPELRKAIYNDLRNVLNGESRDPAFDHLSAEDRQAILEILRETKSDFPDSWDAS